MKRLCVDESDAVSSGLVVPVTVSITLFSDCHLQYNRPFCRMPDSHTHATKSECVINLPFKKAIIEYHNNNDDDNNNNKLDLYSTFCNITKAFYMM